MPSPDLASVEVVLQEFGGRVTQFDPQTLPAGASPFNQDVSFSGVNPAGTGLVAGVATRPGTAQFYSTPFSDVEGNPTVNYLKTFIDPLEVFHELSIDGFGYFRDESPCPVVPGIPSLIGQVVAASIIQSDALFGREWMAISAPTHPGFGIDMPRQYDATNFDRVSQVGPAVPPQVTDDTASYTTLAAPVGLISGYALVIPAGGLSQVGNIVTVRLTAGAAPVPDLRYNKIGDQIQIVGAGIATYDGAWIITNIVSPTIFQYVNPTVGLANSGGGNTFTNIVYMATTTPNTYVVGQLITNAGAVDPAYNGTFPVRGIIISTEFLVYDSAAYTSLGPDGSSTVTATGNISTGLHQVSVSYVTRQNYITKPAPFGSWTAAGGLRAIVSGIPIGPPNIIARILMFTPVITPPAIGGPFFYFDGAVPLPTGLSYPTMVIPNNTATTYQVDFDDATLQLGTAATNLFNLLELGECASVTAYSNRLFWSGERNKLPNLLNMSFDAGAATASSSVPGWIVPATSQGIGSLQTSPVKWGFSYLIQQLFPGETYTGLIQQSVYQDYLGVPIINPNVAYSIRFTAIRGFGSLVNGSVIFELYSASGGGVLSTASENVGNIVSANWTEFILPFSAMLTTVPADTVLRVYITYGAFAGIGIYLENLEIFPTLVPYNNNIIRVSYAGDPESYDQETGYLIAGQSQNQSIRRCFVLLDNKLYIVTERGIYVTQDDGANEPSQWIIDTVSGTVGTGSVRGVAVGPSWAVIAAPDGLYVFWGSEPVNISQEIQPDWDTINWLYDQTIYVTIDTQSKRIHVGAPMGEHTKPNLEFVVDYSVLSDVEGAVSGQEIAAYPQAYFSGDGLAAPGKARKWTIWNIAANCCSLAIRSNGTYKLLRGNNVGNGIVYDQSPAYLSDDGVAINSQYQTAFLPDADQQAAYKIGPHRKLYKYMTGYAIGSGTLARTIYGSQNQRALALTSLTLQSPAHWDWESNMNWTGERGSILFGTDAVGSWFELTKLCLTIQPEIVTPIRGTR